MKHVRGAVGVMLGACLYFSFISAVLSAEETDTPKQRQPIPVIEGPPKARTGDLLFLDASKSTADHLTWLVDVSDVEVPVGGDPEEITKLTENLKRLGFKVEAPGGGDTSPLYAIRNEGKELFLSSYPGTYRIVLAVAVDGAGIKMLPWTIKVSADSPKPEPPDEPDPKPDPEPDPDPPAGFGLAAKVPGWIKTVPDQHKSNAESIAKVLESSGRAAIAGTLKEIKEVESVTILGLQVTIKNKQAWNKFGSSLMTELDALQKSGKIKTVADYGEALVEVAGAL